MAPFKSSLAKSAGKLFGVFKERDLSLRGATQSTRFKGPAPISATGGTKSTPGNGYVYHVFTSPADTPAPYTFQVTAGKADLNVLVVGGGGGGGGKYGGSAGGGGGGAGLVHDRLLPDINPGTYPITVGAGGLGNTYPGSAPNPGDDTVWNAPGTSTPALTAAGGGAGGGGPAPHHNGLPGGSGGGNAYTDPAGNNRSTGSGDPFPGSGSTISPSNGWGNNGGIATPPNRQAGAGGGAGAVGTDGGGGAAGGVGIEISWVLPTHGETKYFAGGGGAGYYPGTGTGGAGGNGGGGTGGGASTAPVSNGQASTGGGAGGMQAGGSTQYRGGSGVVIIRYEV